MKNGWRKKRGLENKEVFKIEVYIGGGMLKKQDNYKKIFLS